MRVIQRNADNLTIEEGAGTRRVIVLFFLAAGTVGLLLWKTQNQMGFLLFGCAFLMMGLNFLVLRATTIHRLERSRGTLSIASRYMWGTRSRELALDAITDVVLEEVRKAGSTPSYYIYYVTRAGEKIVLAKTYDGSEQDTLDCFHAARDFLGLSPLPEAGK